MSASSPGDDHTLRKLQRFLMMGTEHNRYICRKLMLCNEHAFHIKDLIHRGRGVEVVLEILRFANEKLSVRPEALAFALAVCAQSPDSATKSAAYNALKQVCNTAALLFAFTKYMEDTQKPVTTGWGRAHRTSVRKWYLSHSSRQLAEVVTRTVSRYRWSHRDILRLAHVKPPNPGMSCVFRYVAKGYIAAKEQFESVEETEVKETLSYLEAVDELKRSITEFRAARLMQTNPLSIDHIPTQFLHSRHVWLATLPRMSTETLLSWLPYLVRTNLLRPSLGLLRPVVQRISSDEILSNCPWDPYATYILLRSVCATSKFLNLPPTPNIPPTSRMLQDGLYSLHMASFKTLKPTNKNYLIVTDAGPNMWITGSSTQPVTAMEASVLLAMTLCRQEGINGGRVQFMAFARSGLHDLEINQKMTMADLLTRCKEVDPASASLSSPLRWASQRNNEYDMIIICTDRQCNTVDTIHPLEALRDYHRIVNQSNTKYVTCAWNSRGFAVAPPDELLMLDVCSFDENVFKIINNFAKNNC